MNQLVRASEVLRCFQSESEALRLTDIAERCKMHPTTAMRVLHSMTEAGFLSAVGERKFRLGMRPIPAARYRIGFALQSSEFSFCQTVLDSLQRAATAAGVELLVLDNMDTPRTALQNAETFIRDRVDLVIESQTDTRMGHQIAARFAAAKIPVIALEIPQPQAVYYGANNSVAGLIAGRHLAHWALQHWNGAVDQLLLLELPKAGRTPNARILGSMLGVLESILGLEENQIRILRTSGHHESAFAQVRALLRRQRTKRTLVAAINDPVALGTLQAYREAGRENECAIVGHNASPDAHAELLNRTSRLIASVGYFPERYGDGLLRLALEMLAKRPVPRATFVHHEIIHAENLRSYYLA